jgi:hypothetical protein
MDRLASHPDIGLSEEMEIITRILRSKPGIRDVVNEVRIGRPGLREKVKDNERLRYFK